jgi:hypothetical protein
MSRKPNRVVLRDVGTGVLLILLVLVLFAYGATHLDWLNCFVNRADGGQIDYDWKVPPINIDHTFEDVDSMEIVQDTEGTWKIVRKSVTSNQTPLESKTDQAYNPIP